MDTEYIQKKNNRRSLFFLVLLVGFSMLVLKITKTNDIQLFKKSSESVICANDVVDEGYDNTPVFLDISENGNITDVTPKSKGEVLGSASCGNSENQYSAESACTIPANTTSVKVQGWVSTNATIRMVKVTVPVRLLSGIYSVKDSNRDLTYENPVYKPAGEQFNDKQILIKSTPGEGNSKVKENIIEEAVRQEAYSTKYTVSAGTKEGDGDVVISEYALNDCGERCNNLANSNPDKSNRAGEYFQRINYKYPGQKEEGEDSNTITIEGECKNMGTVDMEDKSDFGCFSVWQSIIGALGSIFPSSDWTNCDPEGEGCVNAEDIVIKMSPMFKETNGFTTTRNRVAMDPSTSSSYKAVYVMTPCSANVAGKTVPVKCVWDMSYIFDERKVSEFDDVGGSETPTEGEYVKFLQGESLTRKDPLYSM